MLESRLKEEVEDDPLAREDLSATRPEDVARLQAALHALRPDTSEQTRQSGHRRFSPGEVLRLFVIKFGITQKLEHAHHAIKRRE